jgi:hypothetical protein
MQLFSLKGSRTFYKFCNFEVFQIVQVFIAKTNQICFKTKKIKNAFAKKIRKQAAGDRFGPGTEADLAC